MGFEHGGRASKLGDNYERLWGVSQLLNVVAGDLRVVINEPAGPDSEGADYWVTSTAGVREAQQCKAENGDKGTWSIADLVAADILKHAKTQLMRDQTVRFALVSAHNAPVLSSFIDFTRRCNGDADSLVRDLIQTSAPRRSDLARLCRCWGLDPEVATDRGVLLDLLSRMGVHRLDTGLDGARSIEQLARLLVEGDPRGVVSTLDRLLQESIGNALNLDVVRRCLRSAGLQPWALAGDPLVHQEVERLQGAFARHYEQTLIDGRVLARAEAVELADAVLGQEERRLWLVHGGAGGGKSGVILSLTRALSAARVPYLPLRLDWHRPAGSATHFGKNVCGLPGSPVACLRAIAAGQRRAVLILDQVDAIRWTTAHSGDAWEVCEEIIDAALACPEMRVVVSCRTFDVQEDPRIGRWRSRKSAAEVHVKDLPEPEVKQILETCRVGWSHLSARQKGLLRKASCLALWCRLYRDHPSPSVSNAAELMRAFWTDVRRKIAERGVSGDRLEAGLTALVQFMDREGVLAAPGVLMVDQAVRDSLVALDVLQAQTDGRVSFSHQSFFDYLLAESLLRAVVQRQTSVLAWTREREQSLFRREHVRQVLNLLRASDSPKFVESLRQLLLEQGVRFHLRFMVLSFLRTADVPTDTEAALVLELLERNEWQEHVIEQVIRGRSSWFRVLQHRGIIRSWLTSDAPELVQRALWLMRGVSDECGADVAALSADLDLATETGRSTLAWLLPIDATKDSPEIHELRLRLCWSGVPLPGYLPWDRLGTSHPRRVLELFESQVVLTFDEAEEREQNGAQRGARHARLAMNSEDRAGLIAAAEAEPGLALAQLLPLVVEMNRLVEWRQSCSSTFWDLDDLSRLLRVHSHSCADTERTLAPVLSAASASLARSAPIEFLQLTESFSDTGLMLVETTLLHGFAALAPGHADRALLWLSECPGRLTFADESESRRCQRARSVITQHAAACSPAVFADLEATLLDHRNHIEREIFESRLREHEGRRHPYGREQFLLLSAMPRARLSAAAKSRLIALESKFLEYASIEGEPHEAVGGHIVSPIRRDAVMRLSDREWLRIVAQDRPTRSGSWRQLDAETVGENSVDNFASDLGAVTERDPARGLRLFMALPAEAHPLYRTAILQGLRRNSPPESSTEQEREDWRPAGHDALEQAILRAGFSQRFEPSYTICALIESRASESWSDGALHLLLRLAEEHQDPTPKRLAESLSQDHALTDVGLNTVRGRAARALGAVLLRHPELEERIRPTALRLVEDPAPPVRAQAILLCRSMLNVSRERAVRMMLAACTGVDDRMLAPNTYLNDALSHVVLDHATELLPLIERMVASGLPKVAANGAGWAAEAWLEAGHMEALATTCLRSDRVEHRSAAARAFARSVRSAAPHPTAIETLAGLFADPDVAVRSESSSVFWGPPSVFDHDHAPTVVRAFVESEAFRDDPSHFLRQLKDHRGPLGPFRESIFLASRQFTGPLRDSSRDIGRNTAGAVDPLVSLLLRLYEQSHAHGEQGRRTQDQCLDMLDELLSARVGLMSSVVEKLDS